MDLRGIDVSETAKPRNRWLLPLLLLLVLAGGGYAAYRLLPLAPPEAPEPLPAPLPPAPVEEALETPPPPPAPIPELVAEATLEQAVPLPALPDLDTSDPLVRALVGVLSRRPELAGWLANEELMRRFVASVDNIAEGQSPRSHIGFMQPRTRFAILEGKDRIIVDPGGGARYDAITEVFVSIDSLGATLLYQRLRPLVDEAYVELGYPDADFDETLEAAFAQLLATPILQGPVELVPLAVTYAYADPEVEELAPAQKQLLRMGPGNQRRVQAKLRELAAALGMPTDTLPTATLYSPLSFSEVEARLEAEPDAHSEIEDTTPALP